MFGRASYLQTRGANQLSKIPEEGQPSSGAAANDSEATPFSVPTAANLQKFSSAMRPKKMGARSFYTEKVSMKSYMSSLSSMSNFFRVTDSPFGGVIPSSVLRQAMEKRQEKINQEGAALDNTIAQDLNVAEGETPSTQATKALDHQSGGQQGSSLNTSSSQQVTTHPDGIQTNQTHS